MDSAVVDVQPDTRAARKAARAGLWLLATALLIAAMWIGATLVGALLAFGPERLAQASRLELAAGSLAAALPALLIVFCGLAAREGARARAEGRRLADAADRMLNPSPSAAQATSRVGAAVRHELSALDRALDAVLLKLREAEQFVNRQSALVANTAETARLGAQHMISGMERERDALLQIATDLNSQAKLIGDQISRHARVLSDAARIAETEVRAADAQLDQRLGSFTAATNLIGDRTHALHTAAQATSDSALRLEGALSGALDVLAKATSLTDAARQNAEHAARAADSTATAVRDTTGRAVDDAKHAADLIRTEAAAMERDAARAIERLKEAAIVARDASQSAANSATGPRGNGRAPEGPVRGRPAPEASPPMATRAPPVSAIEDLDNAWSALETSAPVREGPKAAAPEPQRARKPSFAEQLAGAAFNNRHPQEQHKPRQEPRRQERQGGGGWRWRDILATIDRHEESTPAQTTPVHTTPAHITPVQRAEEPIPVAAFQGAEAPVRAAPSGYGVRGQANAAIVGLSRHPLPVVSALERAGVQLPEVFAPQALDRIAQRARNGTQARRRAVRDAAPDAVQRLDAYLRRDDIARAEAAAFLRSEGGRLAELLGRGRAAMTADATRAFLLLDAASS